MKIVTGSRAFQRLGVKNPVVTLGNFDGVHLGHQKILQEAIDCARLINGASVVYTFDPHPLQVLKPEFAPLKLTTRQEQSRRIGNAGIDYLIYERFTPAFARKPAEEFVESILVKRLRPREIVIGYDYAFGKNREGAVPLLVELGKRHDFIVHIIPDIRIKNIPVRSSTLRSLIAGGKVSLAAKLMGRPYCLHGTVVHGKRRRIGFPTANLTPSHRDLTPGNGVYAVRVDTPVGQFDGIVNIGVTPTFHGEKRTIETHIFDFDADLYGQSISLCFVRRIRGEKKFSGVERLAAQITHDIDRAKTILTNSARA